MIEAQKTTKIIDFLHQNIEKRQKTNGLEVASYIYKLLSRYGKTLEKLTALLHFIKLSEQEEPKNENTLLVCVTFLFVFDFYVSLIDLVVLLLICDEHDLFDVIRQKYVHTVEEIGQVDVETKFRFLREHKFESLVRLSDQRLRNTIAHNNFDLIEEQKGVIQCKDKKCNVMDQLLSLMDYNVFLIGQFNSEKETVSG
jgi:hypothetical protein